MENNYSEHKLEVDVEASKSFGPTSDLKESLARVAYLSSIQNVLLAQISENLAILANNTRLIQEKESK